MKQQYLTVYTILPFVIIATIFPAFELWVIFGANSSFLASVEYWFIYGLVVYGCSFVLWYWLIAASNKNKAGRF
ncbi:MAG TPA: hypothetical protein VFA10_30250 [Ktedonobacteraceae bacterium]|nr:hypothetical protein [Ktedonobacteraceae bacterium]